MASDSLAFKIAKPENDEGAERLKAKEEDRFLRARNGDVLTVPFQWEFCWFVNIKDKEACLVSPSDRLLLSYIRRVNLDIIWSREESTVAAI